MAQQQRKAVAAAGIGTPASILLVWLMSVCGLEVPSDVAAAIAALVTAGVAWFTQQPERPA